MRVRLPAFGRVVVPGAQLHLFGHALSVLHIDPFDADARCAEEALRGSVLVARDLRVGNLNFDARRLDREAQVFLGLGSALLSSTGGCNSVLEFSGWGHEAEGLTGAGVQFQGDAVQVLLAVR